MIKVNNLAFSYTKNPFIEDINFEVSRGEIFGFLGPSGAGKSTLQKILTGLISKYSGSATVNGVESKSHNDRFYEDIGVDFEFSSLFDKLTARQNLQFFGSLYSKKLRNLEELLQMVGLTYDADKKVSEYSKGMKARLNFVKALLHNPDIIFLDEPTSGLDPTSSRDMKNIILEEKSKGKTIILTTHNMSDAAELCDKVAFIVDGKIKAMDTPHNLIMSKGATKVKYSFLDKKEVTKECLIHKTADDKELQALLLSNKLLSIHSSEPSLNDIFIEVTGRVLQ